MKQKSDYIATMVSRPDSIGPLTLIELQDARWKDALDENGQRRLLNSKKLLIDEDNEMETDTVDCTTDTIGSNQLVTNAGTCISTIPMEGSKQKKERATITV